MAQSIRLANAKGYLVLPCGSVENPKGKRISTWANQGYLRFSVSTASGSKPVMVHRLSAFQKFGEQIFQPGLEVRHKDGNSLNNAADNLILGTHSQNMMDKPADVRRRCALNAASKVRKHDPEKVRAFYELCGSYGKTMQHFGITSKGTLHYVLNQACGIVTKPQARLLLTILLLHATLLWTVEILMK